MSKSHLLFLFFLFHLCINAFSQCLTALPPPDCNGSEPSLADNETLGTGVTKWYYGAAATYNSLTIDGGTLVVCTDLTIDKFYMNTGTIFVRPGARFIIGSGLGSGLVLYGNCAIYNYGTMYVQRNLSLESGATASTPNIVFNATSTSVFGVPFQYFVINNAHSWFVNNGTGEFGGIITDQYSSAGSVCLGGGSVTRMSTLINKTADSYFVSSGSACVYVSQTSVFNNKLTASPSLYACLSASHNSYSGCGGCPANNWGSANVLTGCSSCSAVTILALYGVELEASPLTGENKLSWHMTGDPAPGIFRVERSADGLHYTTIGTLEATTNRTTSFTFTDRAPLPGYNYYMINHINDDKSIVSSKSVRITALPATGFSISPVPFDKKLLISHSKEIRPEKVIITDMAGKNIRIHYKTDPLLRKIEIDILENIPGGIYIVHIRTDKTTMARTILKE